MLASPDLQLEGAALLPTDRLGYGIREEQVPAADHKAIDTYQVGQRGDEQGLLPVRGAVLGKPDDHGYGKGDEARVLG